MSAVPTPALRVHVMVCGEPIVPDTEGPEQVNASGMAAVPYFTSSAALFEINVAPKETEMGDDPDTAYVDGTEREVEAEPRGSSLSVEAVIVGPANESRLAEPVCPANVTDTGRSKPPIDEAANVQISLVCEVTTAILAHATLPILTEVSDVDAPKPVPVIVMATLPATGQSLAAFPSVVQPATVVTMGG